MEKFFAFIVAAAVLLVVALLFVLVDVACGTVERQTATVVAKAYQAPYVTYTPMHCGKVTTIVPQHHSEKWIVVVTGGNLNEVSAEASPTRWSQVESGSVVSVRYKRGRLLGVRGDVGVD